MGMNAWADGTKRVLDAQNYEAATASDWTSPNGTVSFKTGDATYGNYARVDVSGNGNRSCYKSVTYGYEPNGYTSATMTDKGYIIEFDLRMAGGRQKDRSVAQFIIPTQNLNLATNAAYTGTDFIFALSQPTNTTGGLETTWYINDLSHTKNSVNLADAWHHYKLVVTATTVDYTITKDGQAIATGSLNVTSLPTIKGFWGLTGRTYGYLAFDNLEIYDFTEEVTVSAPTFTFKKVDNENRVYTLTNPNGSGTLYYTTAPSENAPAVGDAAYTSTDEANKEVSFSQSGTYYAYVLHTNGTTASPVTSQTVTSGALTLAVPAFTVINMVKAGDGFYYPQVSFVSNNSTLEGAPTATFDVTSPYSFTSTGSITVTASAEGYTSSTNTFTVSQAYINSNTIDFGALTAADFDDAIWTSGTGAPRDYWTQRAAAIPADVTYYGWKTLSITNGDDVNNINKASLNGITISNPHQRTAQVYIGYGLLAPYDPTKVDGTAAATASNNLNFTVNGATSDDYVVYNGWNNYGNGTFNTVLAGDATFGLYRYDTMLRTINVFSPAPATVPVAVADGKEFATFNSDYALDFANVTDIIAYTAQVSADGSTVTMTKVDGAVPANTGLLIRKAASTSAEVPVAASAAAVTNEFIAVTADNCDEGQEYKTVKEGFILATVGGEQGFYKANSTDGTKVGKGKAYLPATGAAGARLTVKFGDEATGINDMRVVTVDNAVYNLNGVRVSQPTKGLYIVNGKKMVIK